MKKIFSLLLLTLLLLSSCSNEDIVYQYSYTDPEGEEYVSCSPHNIESLHFLSSLMQEKTTYLLQLRSVTDSRECIKSVIRRYDDSSVALFFRKNQSFDSRRYYCMLSRLYREGGERVASVTDITSNVALIEVKGNRPVSISCTSQLDCYRDFDGSGTEADPFIISTVDDMISFQDALVVDKTHADGLYFLQKNDINAREVEERGSITGWCPVGYDSMGEGGFAGSYDGGGKTITDLRIYSDDPVNNAGFFSILCVGSSVSNLNFEDPNVQLKVSTNVGVLCGRADGGSVSEIHIDNPNVSAKSNVGGLVGFAYSNFEMSNVIVDGMGAVSESNTGGIGCGGVVGCIEGLYAKASLNDVISQVFVRGNECVGGIIGKAYTHLQLKSVRNNCPKVEGSYYYVGGIAGYLDGTVNMTNCESFIAQKSTESGTKTISGFKSVGGVFGYANIQDNSYIETLKVGGNFHASQGFLGGLIGYCKGGDLSIGNAYTSVNGSIMSDAGNYVGGLLGYSSASLCLHTDAYNYAEGINNSMSVVAPNSDCVGGFIGEATNTVRMDNMSNIANVSARSNVGGLIGSMPSGIARLAASGSPGKGNSDDKLSITISATKENVGGIVGYLGKADFNIDGEKGTIFRGAVNAVGNSSTNNNGGVVGFLENGEFSACNFDVNGSVAGHDFVGGVIGLSFLKTSGSLIRIDKAHVTSDGTNDGYKDVAGFIGRIEMKNGAGAYISNSTSSRRVLGTTDSAAGFVASIDVVGDCNNDGYLFSDCVNDGDVGSDNRLANHTGGFVGYISNYSSRNPIYMRCVNKGHIKGRNNTAGIQGTMATRLYSDIYHIYNEGIVEGWESGSEENVAGLMGYVYSARIHRSGNYGTIINHGCHHAGGLIGKIGEKVIQTRYYFLSESFNVGTIRATSGYIGALIASAGSNGYSDNEGIRDCYSLCRFPEGTSKFQGSAIGWVAMWGRMKNFYHFGDKCVGLFGSGQAQQASWLVNLYLFRHKTDKDEFAHFISTGDSDNSSVFSGFDFKSVWEIPTNCDHPILKNNREREPYATIVG